MIARLKFFAASVILIGSISVLGAKALELALAHPVQQASLMTAETR